MSREGRVPSARQLRNAVVTIAEPAHRNSNPIVVRRPSVPLSQALAHPRRLTPTQIPSENEALRGLAAAQETRIASLKEESEKHLAALALKDAALTEKDAEILRLKGLVEEKERQNQVLDMQGYRAQHENMRLRFEIDRHLNKIDELVRKLEEIRNQPASPKMQARVSSANNRFGMYAGGSPKKPVTPALSAHPRAKLQ